MTLKVCVLPRARPESIAEATGVGRVIYALAKYLPQYEIEVVEDYTKADLFAPHMQKFELPTAYTDAPIVLHSHGLYFTAEEGMFGQHAQLANDSIAVSLRRANRITVPAHWVGEVFRRDMRIDPMVIGHGIELDQWGPAYDEGYIFYAKNREGDVCTSRWAYELAKRGEEVVSTFMPAKVPRLDKMQVMGYLDAPILKDRMQHADVYLATTPETFGVTTLEALACGVPVLGFNWGGTKDIVRHKVDGYLAKPRDIEDLMNGLKYIRSHRNELSQNARERVKAYTWDKVIGKYANLYREVYAQPRPTGVSVVVTNHNYKQYVGQAIDSILAQTYPVEEIIVVDDGSTDGSQDYLKANYGDRVRLVLQQNQGVASARNNGIRQATQPFVICLDADDMLEPTYVEVCRNEMLKDRATGIVYTGLVYFNDEEKINPNNVQLTQFNWAIQTKRGNPPPTCIPCAAMFRKDMWERVGGYKQRYAPAEDSEFWLRGLVSGFEARVASPKGLFLYRGHLGSASRTLRYKPIDDDKPYLLDRQFPFAAPAPSTSKVRSYSEPAITILLDVKRGQEYNVPDAIDSVVGQSIREWELILNAQDADTNILAQVLKPYPFVKQGVTPSAGLMLRLNADNKLKSDALEQFAMSFSKNLILRANELYQDTERVDMSNCCGGNGDATLQAKRMLGLLPRESPVQTQVPGGRVRMRYVGSRKGSVSYIHPSSPKDIYIAGDNDDNRFIFAKSEHVNWLLGTNVFVVDQELPPIESRPEPTPQVQVMVAVPTSTPVATPVVTEAKPALYPEAKPKKHRK